MYDNETAAPKPQIFHQASRETVACRENEGQNIEIKTLKRIIAPQDSFHRISIENRSRRSTAWLQFGMIDIF